MSLLPSALTLQQALIRSSEYHHNKQNARLGAIGQATKGIVSANHGKLMYGSDVCEGFHGHPAQGKLTRKTRRARRKHREGRFPAASKREIDSCFDPGFGPA
jgi:hypothetical protein